MRYCPTGPPLAPIPTGAYRYSWAQPEPRTSVPATSAVHRLASRTERIDPTYLAALTTSRTESCSSGRAASRSRCYRSRCASAPLPAPDLRVALPLVQLPPPPQRGLVHAKDRGGGLETSCPGHDATDVLSLELSQADLIPDAGPP